MASVEMYDRAMVRLARLASQGIGTLRETIRRPTDYRPYRIAVLEARWPRDTWVEHVRRIANAFEGCHGVVIQLYLAADGLSVRVAISRDLTPEEFSRLAPGEEMEVYRSAEVIG